MDPTMKLTSIVVEIFSDHGRQTIINRNYVLPDNMVLENDVVLYPDRVTTYLYNHGSDRQIDQHGIHNLIRTL